MFFLLFFFNLFPNRKYVIFPHLSTMVPKGGRMKKQRRKKQAISLGTCDVMEKEGTQ